MLPTKVFQLDYQDFSHLVWSHIPRIEEAAPSQGYDIVVSKLRNGVIVGSILANYFSTSLGVIEAPRGAKPKDFRLFWPEEIRQKSHVSILLVDSICGTGQTLQELKEFLALHCPQAQVTSYVTLVDCHARVQPDVVGEYKKEYIQPPWEWKSFTPQSHLERLEAGHTKAATEQDGFIGYSSEACKQSVENATGKLIDYEWTKVFNNFADDQLLAQATSGISSLNVSSGADFMAYKTTLKKVIEEKVEFILSNGVSHYVEDSMPQALLVSCRCPVTHVFFFDGDSLHRIYAKSGSFEEIHA